MLAVAVEADFEPQINLDWEHEYYTKSYNRYFRVIKLNLRLTTVQQAMIQLVIDLTSGYHRQTAAISNADFARSAFVSERTIINAKKYLLETGFLVEVRRGTGRKKSVYGLNLDYDKAPLSEEAKKPVIRIVKAAYPDSEIASETDDTQEAERTQQEAKVYKPDLAEEESATETDAAHLDSVQQSPAAKVGIQEIPQPTHRVAGRIHSITYYLNLKIDKHIKNYPSADPPAEEKPANLVKSSDSAYSDLFAPLALCISINTRGYIKEKQTGPEAENDRPAENKKAHDAAYAAVCYHFKIFGIPLTPKDRRFVHWAITKYGTTAVIDKVNIMRSQRARGVKFTNPLGWLNSALQRGYQPSERDQKKAKADKFFKDETKRNVEKQKQTEQRSAREDKERSDFAALKSKMTSGARAELREKAMEKARKMGITVEFMNPRVIEQLENEILACKLAS